jgi:hypothetical protein
MFRKILLSAVLIAGSAAANADVIYNEGFDDVSSLAAAGWVQTNNSTAGGETGWFQGNSGVFAADSGAADSYIAANYLNAGLGGNVDNWLITPVFHIEEHTLVSFATRTSGALPGDNLETLYSLGGTNTDTDFFSIATLFSSVYPTDWATLSLIGTGTADIRLAFRYLVTDTLNNGDYIGIDSLSVKVPEPSTIALFAAALLMMFAATRRRRGQI